MKIKTNELRDAALDRAVARAWYGPEYDMSIPLFDDGRIFAPSTDWAHGGPIIERENIATWPLAEPQGWGARKVWGEGGECTGPTPLIAAMRCFVASRLGDEVDVPDDLQPNN